MAAVGTVGRLARCPPPGVAGHNCAATSKGSDSPRRPTSLPPRQRNIGRAIFRQGSSGSGTQFPLHAVPASMSAPAECGSLQRVTDILAELNEKQPVALQPPNPKLCHRVLSLTDIHTDREDNFAWIKSLAASGEHGNDTLLLCGDVADNLEDVEKTLKVLAGTFGHVFFTPGNHDLWLRGHERSSHSDSLDKLAKLLQICADTGVHVAPSLVGGVWVAPLWSWHHSSWDTEPDVEAGSLALSHYIQDYRACKWPAELPGGSDSGSEQVAAWFDQLNEPSMARLLTRHASEPVISFSHFLPRQELMPEKRFLYMPCLFKAAGSNLLEKRIRKLAPDVHCFGHTHFSWDQTIEGIRYMQCPLCYPSERKKRLPSVAFSMDGADVRHMSSVDLGENRDAGWLPVELHRCMPAEPHHSSSFAQEGGNGGPSQTAGFCPPLSASWSNYYNSNSRDPSNVEPAPWVANRLARKRGRGAFGEKGRLSG